MQKPKHIAIIMDGNGRWATARGRSRSQGHRAGVKAMRKVITGAFELGVECVTVFAFSTENWKRPQNERKALFDIVRRSLTDIKKLAGNNIRVLFLGDLSALPEDVADIAHQAEESTRHCTQGTLAIALNYGGRAEIVRAAELLAQSGQQFSQQSFESFLYTSQLPELDLLIRTGGEKRLSNFLLYQASYAELFFTDTLFPDFDRAELARILDEYAERTRRFGGITSNTMVK